MKRLLWAAAALACLLALAACGGKKSAESEAEEFRKELTKEDTTQMLALCDDCMKTLKAGRIDEALNRLYTYDDSTATVAPITATKREELKRTFRLFPVLGYEMDYYSFNSEGQNDVKYDIRFFEKTDSADTTPNTIGFMFNPVKVDGQWYLCIKEADQEFDRARNR